MVEEIYVVQVELCNRIAITLPIYSFAPGMSSIASAFPEAEKYLDNEKDLVV
ncbi:MAG TPA: hypothetical protein ACFYEK_12265 [Candidatus Wunengus sp. YC60]